MSKKNLQKLDEGQYQDYWVHTHKKFHDDLQAVCFPGKPRFFNLFFDRIQKYALSRYISRSGIDLKNANVLDIGCGRGRWLHFWKERYKANATGLDLSAESVIACANQGLYALCGSVTDIPLPGESFNMVSSITVLLHLPYHLKESAVKELFRILKSGGIVIMIESTWNDPSPHVYGMPVAEWKSLFTRCGFMPIFQWAHCFNWIRRIIPKRNPTIDTYSILLEYPLEYALMNCLFGKESNLGMQHIMVFKK